MAQSARTNVSKRATSSPSAPPAAASCRRLHDRHILQQCYAQIRVAALSYRHRFSALVREAPHPDLFGDNYTSGLIATCTLYGALRTASRIAGVLAHLGDHEVLEALAEDVRKAFRRRYLTRDGHLQGDTQSVHTAALYHGMLEADERTIAETRLIELLQNNGYHADVCPAVLHALLPVLTRAGCNAGTCHGAKDGKNGFKLSLRGYDPIFDVRALTDDLESRRTNLASASSSLFLQKPTGQVPHEGGMVLPRGSDYYKTLLAWVSQGAQLKLDSPRIASIAVLPVNPVVQQVGTPTDIFDYAKHERTKAFLSKVL